MGWFNIVQYILFVLLSMMQLLHLLKLFVVPSVDNSLGCLVVKTSALECGESWVQIPPN